MLVKLINPVAFGDTAYIDGIVELGEKQVLAR